MGLGKSQKKTVDDACTFLDRNRSENPFALLDFEYHTPLLCCSTSLSEAHSFLAHKNSDRTRWLATNQNSNTLALTSELSLRQNKNRDMTQLSYNSFDGHFSLHRV